MLTSSPVCASATLKSRRNARRWLRNVTVERRGRMAANNGSSVGSASASSMNAHHGNAMFTGNVQPISNAARLAGADSERRRLSSIFHRPMSGMRL